MTLKALRNSPHLHRRVVPLDEWLTLTPAERARRLSLGLIPPMAGADGEGEGGEGEGEGADGAAGAAGSDEGEGDGGEGSGDGEGSEEEPEPKNEAERELRDLKTQLKSASDELNRHKRERAEAEKRAKLDRRRVAAEEGRWQEVAQEHEQERDEAIRERDGARAELQAFKREVTVSRVATRLQFRDPADAIHFIDSDAADNEKLAEAELKRVAKNKPYLVDQTRRTGLVGGNGNGKPESAEQGFQQFIAERLGTPTG